MYHLLFLCMVVERLLFDSTFDLDFEKETNRMTYQSSWTRIKTVK